MFRAITLAAMVAVASLGGGCSVYMAASSEGKRDTNILTPGTTRAAVLAELGAPIATVPVAPAPSAAEGPASGVSVAPIPSTPAPTAAIYDVFRFTQERSTGSNAGRAVFYGAAAVLTLGLSEVIATPLEAAVGDAGEIRLRVYYGADDRVQRSEVLNGDVWKPFGPGVAP